MKHKLSDRVRRMAVVFLVSCAMALTLVGCGSETKDTGTEVSTNTEAGSGGEVTEAVTEKETEAVTGKETETVTGKETETVTEAVTEKETGEGTESEGKNMGIVRIYYQGHGSMRITATYGETIYVDPFMGDGYENAADLILITHGHYDHTQTDLIKNRNADCRMITWKEALEGGKHQTFDLGYVKIEAVEAGYNRNHDVSNCVGYILTFQNQKSVYISGDTSTTPQMKEFAGRNLDYAFFCCDGVYNMDMEEAIECAKLVGARHSIPYHMVPSDNSNGFDQTVAESFDVPGRIILKPGEELTIE